MGYWRVAFFAATDPFWFLYLFWIPDFLYKTRGVTLFNLGLPMVVIYVAADFGSVGGGWLSGALIHRGWSVNAARKTAMLIFAHPAGGKRTQPLDVRGVGWLGRCLPSGMVREHLHIGL